MQKRQRKGKGKKKKKAKYLPFSSEAGKGLALSKAVMSEMQELERGKNINLNWKRLKTLIKS